MDPSTLTAKQIADLESRIGHVFSGHDLLHRALTHASATKTSDDTSHYERLEFLGDRVLGLCVAEMLSDRYPEAREGELSVRLNALVSGSTCAEIADKIGLHEFIQAGSDIKQIRGKRMTSVRADVVESLMAAIYLDGGLEAAKAFVDRYWRDRAENENAIVQDSKTALQEWAHISSGVTPKYSVVDRTGPDHDPLFVVEVILSPAMKTRGKGSSKRAAEQAAAEALLLAQKVWESDSNGNLREVSRHE